MLLIRLSFDVTELSAVLTTVQPFSSDFRQHSQSLYQSSTVPIAYPQSKKSGKSDTSTRNALWIPYLL